MKRNQKRRHGDLSFGDPDPGTRDSLGVVEGEDRKPLFFATNKKKCYEKEREVPSS
jgi:hypothetical protein